MHATFPDELPLICPRCRTKSERGLELHTLTLVARAPGSDGDNVREGTLGCVNEKCNARYPVVHGIPIVVADLQSFVAGQLHALVEGDVDLATAALVAGAGPDSAPYSILVEHLSIYLDTQWGDRAEPPPDGVTAPFGSAALVERLAARRAEPVDLAVELGAGLGRGVAELARGAKRVVGIDINLGALRRARRLLDGETVPYLRRVSGRHYRRATVAAGDLTSPNVELVCADALDPPLAPGSANRIAALNLYDVVTNPKRLLSVADALCSRFGELIVSSPFNWQSNTVPDEHRPSAADPAADLARHLTLGTDLDHQYTIVEETDLPWTLRRDARSSVSYAMRYLRARPVSGPR